MGCRANMTHTAKQRKLPLIRIGIALIALSYVCLALTFIFAAIALAGQTGPWYWLGIAAYALSWLLFVAGFIVAGPDTARASHRWLLALFKRKNPTDSI